MRLKRHDRIQPSLAAEARRILWCGLGALSLLCLAACGQKRTPERVVETGARPAPPVVVAPRAVPLTSSPDIRVAVMKDQASIQVAAGSSGARILGQGGQALASIAPNASATFSAGPNGLVVDGAHSLPVTHARIESQGGEPLRLRTDNGLQELSPRLAVARVGSGLHAIATLPIEEYLLGVLAGEVPFNKWHPEALKAQAVTSRTYALYQVQKNAGELYDVESTVMSQVFKVGYSDHPILSPVVNATRGLVMQYEGRVFPAYFHSTCGGSTARAETVFPDQSALRPLSGTNCPYCTSSPHYRWTLQLSKDSLASRLRGAIPGITRVDQLEFIDENGQRIGSVPGQYRRAVSVRVRHNGGVATLQGNQFRLAVSARELKSLNLAEVHDRGGYFDLAGAGFGHGVGLCQFGSHGMASSGQPYASVLGMYFPGASLTKMY